MTMDVRALTVRQLNFYVKSLLEGDVHLQSVAVTGELSNFKRHLASGHWYFTLKDGDAAIRCVMFRGCAARVPFAPEDGKQVVLIGRVSLYEKDGQYQFYAEEMLPVGAGKLAMQFEQVKQKLEKEGLFDPARKRPLPAFPTRIAVVTSPTGAAVQDILNILGRRFPLCAVLLCPVSVQGESAVPDMLAALDRVYARDDIDLIILGRGGGSAEDLQAFNNEELARKVAASPVPVISAVGHETDFSITDFTADLRAPTPSAAAELAVPNVADLSDRLDRQQRGMKNALVSCYQYHAARLRAVLASPAMQKPQEFLLGAYGERLDRAEEKTAAALQASLASAESRFSAQAAKLDSLSPVKVMARGYAAVEKNGRLVAKAHDLQVGDTLDLKFADGAVAVAVTERNV